MDTREIFRLAQQREESIARIVGGQIDALAVGLPNIICLLQPSKMMAEVWQMRENAFSDQLQKRIWRLIPGRLLSCCPTGEKWGGAIGAALLLASALQVQLLRHTQRNGADSLFLTGRR